MKENKKKDNYDKGAARIALVGLLGCAGLLRQASLLEKCSTNEAMLHCHCGNDLKIVRYRCRQMLCPDCQQNKAFKASKEAESMITVLKGNVPGLRVLFVTLTIPSCSEQNLKNEVKNLPKNFGKLLRKPALKTYLIGGIRVVETKFNKRTGTFNPHLHALIVVRSSFFSKGYISNSKFLSLWKDAANNKNISQIEIKEVKPDQKNNTSLAVEVANVVRYMLKPIIPSDWTPDSIAVLTSTKSNQRQYEFLGELRAARKLIPRYSPPCSCDACLVNQNSES